MWHEAPEQSIRRRLTWGSRAVGTFFMTSLTSLWACSGITGSGDSSLRGSYPLVRFNGQPLPVDLGTIPTRDGKPGPCHMLIRDGSLHLDGNRFIIAYDVHSSCDNAVVSSVNSSGTFEKSGSSLTFTVDLGGGVSRTYAGTVGSGVIIAVQPPDTLSFSR